MEREDLIKRLVALKERQNASEICGDFDKDHISADNLLLEYIDDEEITKAFLNIERWYS